jgi:two-component system, cell cycle response regulator DivK
MPDLPTNPSVTPAPTPIGPLVLIVDDDDDTRFLYAESLQSMGYRTAGECDAQRGIEAAFRLQPDAIVMDIAMPGMSGLEATRILKADPRTSRCLVTVVTGAGMKWFDAARAAGCDAYFGKPFDPSVLDYVLRAAPSSSALPVELPRHIVKRCSCGRDYTLAQWLVLPRGGRMNLARRESVVELRHCACGSSMVLRLDGLETDDASDDESGPQAALQTVVVVERNPHVRRLVLHFIGSAYLVEFFDDGYAVLDRVRKSPPAAVIAEIMIPRLDGLALCQLLKGDSSTAHVPVLLFSVLAAAERARIAGANAFLPKPLEKELFVTSLIKLMEPQILGRAPAPRESRKP